MISSRVKVLRQSNGNQVVDGGNVISHCEHAPSHRSNERANARFPAARRVRGIGVTIERTFHSGASGRRVHKEDHGVLLPDA
jgi:hypothetical protein